MTAVPWDRCAVVVPAGGGGRRMTGPTGPGCDKPGLALGSSTLLGVLLAAVPDGVPVVVVGPARDLPARGLPVLVVREEPAGAGPAAAVGAGLAALVDAGHLAAPSPGAGPPRTGGPVRDLVAVCAGDAPWAPTALPALLGALVTAPPSVRGVVGVDAGGHRQPLLAVHRLEALLARTAELGDLTGASAGSLLGARDGGVLEVVVDGRAAFDVDTPADLDRARQLLAAPDAAAAG